MFKLRTKKILLMSRIALGCLAFNLISCSDSDEPRDTTSPEVEFTNLTMNQEVWNTVNLELDVTDNGGISSVEIFIDDVLVSTLTQAPFNISWDSNTIADGTHTVKVNVTDAAGNIIEKEISIVVKNTLLRIRIPNDNLYSDEDYEESGYVFLSDETGKVIASQKYHNGDQITLKASQFSGNSFYLTEVFVRQETGSEPYVRLATFPAIERGTEWVLIDFERDSDPTYAGEATLNFSNIASSNDATYTASSSGDTGYADEFNTSSTIRLIQNPSRLYVVRHHLNAAWGVDRYRLYTNVALGNNSINLLGSAFTPLTKVTATLPADVEYAAVELDGFPTTGSYTESYTIGDFYLEDGETSLDVLYPGTAFPSYYAELFYETDNIYYNRGTKTEFTNFSIPTHTVDVSFANNTMTYSANGNFDIVSVLLENEDENDWFFILPKGSNISVPSLKLPDFMSSLTVPTYSESVMYSILDYEGMDSYADLKTYIKNSTHSISELEESKINFVQVQHFLTPSGGRTKSKGRIRPSYQLSKVERRK